MTEHDKIIVDADAAFSIDPITRQIKNHSTQKTKLMQYDHKSERFSFTIPRYVDGHDMSESDRIEIHFINTDLTTKETSKGRYIIEDLVVNPENDEEVIFTWLISNTATQFPGTLAFSIRFLCLEGENVVYSWNTDKCKSISIGVGCECDEGGTDVDNPDVLEEWKKEIEDSFISHKNNENKNVNHLTDAEKTNVEKIPGISDDLNSLIMSTIPGIENQLFRTMDEVYELTAPPVTAIPNTLEPNTAYNFGSQNAALTLTFPSIANDGDVIYIGFVCREGLNLVVDTTNTFNFDLVPEKDTGYEIYAKCTTNLGVLRWILKYSEYSGVGE